MDGAPPPETENPCRRPWCAHGWDTSDISSKIGSSQFTTPQKSLFIQRDPEFHQNSMTKHHITLPIFLLCGKSSGGNSLQHTKASWAIQPWKANTRYHKAHD
jgi:hypothetical protein